MHAEEGGEVVREVLSSEVASLVFGFCSFSSLLCTLCTESLPLSQRVERRERVPSVMYNRYGGPWYDEERPASPLSTGESQRVSKFPPQEI